MTDVGALISTPDEHIIALSKEGKFDISIVIDKSTYYRIGRNQLYLPPGDDMEIYLDYYNNKASLFSGKGAEANMYLRNTPFPKGGSFLESGDALADTPEATLENILSKAKERTRTLAALKTVSPLFRKLEAARIDADVINSIRCAPGYYSFYNKGKDIYNNPFISKFNSISAPEIKRRLSRLNDTAYLYLTVYRDILDEITGSGKASPTALKVMKEW